MDYEKPEVLSPQIFPHGGHISPQPDAEDTLNNFDEPTPAGEKRELRGDALWRVLDERHINVSWLGLKLLLCL
jgi:amino acid transporter